MSDYREGFDKGFYAKGRTLIALLELRIELFPDITPKELFEYIKGANERDNAAVITTDVKEVHNG